MKFKNQQNGFIEETNRPGLWTLLFGFFYFGKHGAWNHVVISFIVAAFTGGLSWLIYPFFGREIIRKSYLRKGWVEVPENTPARKTGEYLKVY